MIVTFPDAVKSAPLFPLAENFALADAETLLPESEIFFTDLILIPFFPAGQVHHGQGEAKALVIDDPNATFEIQAGATVADTQLHLNMDVSLSAGSTITGMSGFSLKGGSGSVQAKTLRLLRRSTLPGEAATDAFPNIEVKINQHRDHYGLGSTVSIANLA